MSGEHEVIADRGQSLLAAYRADEALPADVRVRVLARVQQSAGAGATVTVDRREAVATTGVRMTVIGLALAAAVAAVWFGRELVSPTQVAMPSSSVHERSDATTDVADERLDVITTPAEAAVTPAITPAVLSPVTAPPVSVPRVSAAESAPSITPRASTRPSARAPEVEIDAFADETELLRAAQAARARGDAREAIALLDAGTRRFGTGALAEERAALHVLALCDLGRDARARKDAAAFARTYPGSPLLGRVTSACAGKSSDAP